MKKPPPKTPWAPPTRRAFVSMIGAAAAALALRTKTLAAEAPRPKKPTRWIGHC